MILCDLCRKVKVDTDGSLCEACEKIEQSDLAEDRQGVNHNVYLPPDLFKRFKQLNSEVEQANKGAQTLMGKMMSVLKTAFINPDDGKMIVNPKPNVITPREGNVAKIQRILDHNARVQAEQFVKDEDLDDWSIENIESDEFEQSILQVVANIEPMKEDEVEPVSTEKQKFGEKGGGTEQNSAQDSKDDTKGDGSASQEKNSEDKTE